MPLHVARSLAGASPDVRLGLHRLPRVGTALALVHGGQSCIAGIVAPPGEPGTLRATCDGGIRPRRRQREGSIERVEARGLPGANECARLSYTWSVSASLAKTPDSEVSTMDNMPELEPQDIAARAHDITVCMERTSVPEFDLLSTLGMAVRLALHLRGVAATSYDIIREVAIYLLDFPAMAVRPVLEFLEEAEFVYLDTQGKTIKTVIPNVPYYDALFSRLAECARQENLSEPEWLTLLLVHRLAGSPLVQDHAYEFGAEKRLVDRIIDIGSQGSFIISRRARGRPILLSPTYFPENPAAYADLVAASGASRVKRILDVLRANQGWPLALLESCREVGGVKLDDTDIAVVRMLAGEGFVPPPAIRTRHAGLNHFLFGPRPGQVRLAASKRPIYEAAMALVAAMRQGQLLPEQYAIHWPKALLRSLRDTGYIRANTEALEQYRQVATLKVGRLEQLGSSRWSRFVLIQRPENVQAIDMAISMLSGTEVPVEPQEEVVIALRKGEGWYIESLLARKRMVQDETVPPDEGTRAAIESFLLRGRQ